MFRRHGLMVLVFFSGLAALTYQVLWLRRLSLVFGVTVYAASTVLAAFMAGLAIGSLLAGRWLRRPRVSPIAAFGLAEILIGVAGLASPALLDAASAIYQAVHRLAPDSLPLLTVVRLACSFAILVLPTALMGLTFPFLTAGARGTVGTRVGALYAMNTAGAAAGALATGFWLIPAIGIQRSFLLAATINVIVGSVAVMMSRGAATDPDADSIAGRGDSSPLTRIEDWRWRAVVGFSGLAALGLEIVWFRLLTQFVEATSHAFTLMLVAVLAGLAIGGALAPVFLRKFRNRADWLAGIQMCTALLVVISMHVLVSAVRRGWMIDLSSLMLVSIVPSAILMGLAFPVALAAVAERGSSREEVGRRVGQMYAANVVGAIAGSLATGFLLVPRIGSRWSLVTLAGCFLVGGLCVPRPGRG